MAHAEICPVCSGKGQVALSAPFTTGATRPCHGCGGTGWVMVQDPAPFIPTVKAEDENITHLDHVKIRVKDECRGLISTSRISAIPLISVNESSRKPEHSG